MSDLIIPIAEIINNSWEPGCFSHDRFSNKMLDRFDMIINNDENLEIQVTNCEMITFKKLKINICEYQEYVNRYAIDGQKNIIIDANESLMTVLKMEMLRHIPEQTADNFLFIYKNYPGVFQVKFLLGYEKEIKGFLFELVFSYNNICVLHCENVLYDIYYRSSANFSDFLLDKLVQYIKDLLETRLNLYKFNPEYGTVGATNMCQKISDLTIKIHELFNLFVKTMLLRSGEHNKPIIFGYLYNGFCQELIKADDYEDNMFYIVTQNTCKGLIVNEDGLPPPQTPHCFFLTKDVLNGPYE